MYPRGTCLLKFRGKRDFCEHGVFIGRTWSCTYLQNVSQFLDVYSHLYNLRECPSVRWNLSETAEKDDFSLRDPSNYPPYLAYFFINLRCVLPSECPYVRPLTLRENRRIQLFQPARRIVLPARTWYMRPRISIRGIVRPSVCLSVSKGAENVKHEGCEIWWIR